MNTKNSTRKRPKPATADPIEAGDQPGQRRLRELNFFQIWQLSGGSGRLHCLSVQLRYVTKNHRNFE